MAACIAAPRVMAQDFDERCRTLAEAATVSVVFEDAPITWDTQHRPEELDRMDGKTSRPHHLVLGLTTARPTARMKVEHRSHISPSGRACVVGSLVLTLGFSELRVYLASTLEGPCRRRIVEQHELEHVRIWRNHMRAGARMIEAALQKQLTSPLYIESADQAETALRQHITEVVTPLVSQLSAAADLAQREIDTPESYRAAASRYRACP